MSTPRNELLCWASATLIFFFAIACIIYVSGCVPMGKPAEVQRVTDDVSECSAKVTETIFANDGCSNREDCCNQAQFRVDGLLKTLPVCKGWRPFDVCSLLKDGGPLPLQKDGGSDGDH